MSSATRIMRYRKPHPNLWEGDPKYHKLMMLTLRAFNTLRKLLMYGLNLEKINVEEKSTLTVKTTSILRRLIQKYWFMPSYSFWNIFKHNPLISLISKLATPTFTTQPTHGPTLSLPLASPGMVYGGGFSVAAAKDLTLILSGSCIHSRLLLDAFLEPVQERQP